MTLKENRTKKIAQVKEVEDLRKNGIRVEAACIKVGIHKSNYYAYKNETHGATTQIYSGAIAKRKYSKKLQTKSTSTVTLIMGNPSELAEFYKNLNG